VEVRPSAIRRNLRRIAGAVGPDAVAIPMVKADAYGLGAREAVRALEPEDPTAFGVAAVDEGRRLRSWGVTRPVLVFSPVPPGEVEAAVEAGLTLCLSSLEALDRLADAATAAAAHRDPAAEPVPFHVEVDTGMGRSGFDWRRADAWGPAVSSAHGGPLRWAGIFTHFHSADLDGGATAEQIRRFRATLDALELPDDGDFLVHEANSAAALRRPLGLLPAVRPGIFLYGGRAGASLPPPERVVSVRARVALVREVPAGTTVGYGATYRASSDERWATLAIGYGDGLPRSLGNRGEVLVAGRRVPIVGRISMDLTVVNISVTDGVDAGHVATVIGRDGEEEITVDEVADLAGTIGYEILTGLTGRLPRIWETDGL